MESETLHAHRSRWGTESSPTSAELDRLTPNEAAVYDDLVSDRHGERVRLEQERIDWAWALDRDRKSTRLNSSHVAISYAVFCLKKKTLHTQDHPPLQDLGNPHYS